MMFIDQTRKYGKVDLPAAEPVELQPAPPVQHHRALVELPLPDLCALLTTNMDSLCIQGLPADTQILSAHFAPERQVLVVVVEHPNFPAVLEGAQLSRLPLHFSRGLELEEGDTGVIDITC